MKVNLACNRVSSANQLFGLNGEASLSEEAEVVALIPVGVYDYLFVYFIFVANSRKVHLDPLAGSILSEGVDHGRV